MDDVEDEDVVMQNVTEREGRRLGWWPWPSDPTLVQGDGDGTVNIRSLKVRTGAHELQDVVWRWC